MQPQSEMKQAKFNLIISLYILFHLDSVVKMIVFFFITLLTCVKAYQCADATH